VVEADKVEPFASAFEHELEQHWKSIDTAVVEAVHTDAFQHFPSSAAYHNFDTYKSALAVRIEEVQQGLEGASHTFSEVDYCKQFAVSAVVHDVDTVVRQNTMDTD
jgi:hypothetical protein